MKFGGGSVMLWGCMLWDGPGYASRIDGRMDGGGPFHPHFETCTAVSAFPEVIKLTA